jgi:hypothetical protein
MMNRPTSKRMAVIALLMATSLLAAEAHAEGSSAGARALSVAEKGFDVVLLRPLGIAAQLVGAGCYIPVVFLASPGGGESVGRATSHFIIRPYEFVWERPLGDF